MEIEFRHLTNLLYMMFNKKNKIYKALIHILFMGTKVAIHFCVYVTQRVFLTKTLFAFSWLRRLFKVLGEFYVQLPR